MIWSKNYIFSQCTWHSKLALLKTSWQMLGELPHLNSPSSYLPYLRAFLSAWPCTSKGSKNMTSKSWKFNFYSVNSDVPFLLLIPFEVEGNKVPQLKALIYGEYEPMLDRNFNICQEVLKRTNLLHKQGFVDSEKETIVVACSFSFYKWDVWCKTCYI